MKLSSLVYLGLSLCSSVAAIGAAAAKIPPVLPVETFFKKPNFSQLSFSPDGKKIACLIPYQHRLNVAVIDLEKKTKNLLTNFTDYDVGSLLWVGDNRLVFTKDEAGMEQPSMMAVDADGKNPLLLASRKGGVPFRGFIGRHHGDPRHILIYANDTLRDVPDVCLMDIVNGKLSVVARNPGHVGTWVLDQNQNVRFAIEEQGGAMRVLYREPGNQGDWIEVEACGEDDPQWWPLAFDADGHTVYVSSTIGHDRQVICRYDTATRRLSDVICEDPVYDVDTVVTDRDDKRVLGFSYEAERGTHYVWLDPDRKTLQREIDASLPDTANVLVQESPDHQKMVIVAYSDRDPGVYYLFERQKKKIEELAVRIPEIDPEQMAPMQPVSYRARDGLLIHGYLTLPVGRAPQHLPLIIHPHGGPYPLRDDWGYDPEVQFYANRGYAVLQINYRGSGSYGRSFERAGWKRWGLEMQDDLSDGVKWAIGQGIADPARVVISGASYGGYATMAGLAFTPELYCAGINYVGVTDIELLIPKAAPPERLYWINTRIADWSKAEDRKRVHDTSPVHFANRIRVPLLMAYGVNDARVEVTHGYAMESALKKAGVPFEMIMQKGEGHGFRKEEKSIEFYTHVDAFLAKYVPTGGGAPAQDRRR